MCVGWGRDFDEHRPFCGDLVNPIEHQRVQMRVEICGRPKTLNQCYRAGGRVFTFNTRLMDEMPLVSD